MDVQNDRPKEKKMAVVRIRVALLQAGVTQAEIARRLSRRLRRNVSRQEINGVVRFQRPTKDIRQEICNATGLSYEELWSRDAPHGEGRLSWPSKKTC